MDTFTGSHDRSSVLTAVPPRTTHEAARPRVPLPLLGVTLAWSWVVIREILGVVLTSSRTRYYGAWWLDPVFLVTYFGVVAVLVVGPLCLPVVPRRFRNHALPFFVGAAVLGFPMMSSAVVLQLGSLAGILSALALMLYAMGWTRLRGRPGVTVLWALLTPVLSVGAGTLWSYGFYVSGAYRQFHLENPVASAAISCVDGLCVIVAPVAIPVLLAGLARPVTPDPRPVPVMTGPVDTYRYVGTNGLAVASLVLSLIGGSLLAVIFGHVSRSQIRRTGEQGEGLAVAGLVIGYIGLAVVAAWMIVVLTVYARIL